MVLPLLRFQAGRHAGCSRAGTSLPGPQDGRSPTHAPPGSGPRTARHASGGTRSCSTGSGPRDACSPTSPHHGRRLQSLRDAAENEEVSLFVPRIDGPPDQGMADRPDPEVSLSVERPPTPVHLTAPQRTRLVRVYFCVWISNTDSYGY